jgi:hypothetical protein
MRRRVDCGGAIAKTANVAACTQVFTPSIGSCSYFKTVSLAFDSIHLVKNFIRHICHI